MIREIASKSIWPNLRQLAASMVVFGFISFPISANGYTCYVAKSGGDFTTVRDNNPDIGVHEYDNSAHIGNFNYGISDNTNSPITINYTVSEDSITGTSYYVKPASEGGNDNNNGKSDTTAWATVNKVNNHNFQEGENIFFKCGGIWVKQRLVVDWSGTENNRVVVGAYYMEGGNEVIGVSGNKPVFDGEYDDFPSNKNLGFIEIHSKKYISLGNIKFMNSRGVFVLVAASEFINLFNLDCIKAFNAGIKIHGSRNCIISGCDISETGRKAIEPPSDNWPATIAIVRDSKSIIVRKTIVHNNYGEGIGLYYGIENSIVEDNFVYENMNCNIYISQSANNIVRRNLVFSGSDGIGINDENVESTPFCFNNKVYDNLVSNCTRGIFLSANYRINGEYSNLKNIEVYNNTVVNSIYQNIYIHQADPNCKFENSFVKNNIFYLPNGGNQALNDYSGSGITIDNNLWSSNPIDRVKGQNDIYDIPQLLRTSGWDSLTVSDLKGSDFTLQSTSPAIDAGTNLGSPYNQGLCPVSIWPNDVSILDQNHYGSGWEIGAYVNTINTTPPFCGDSICNGEETCLTCPEDCGECQPPRSIIPQADWVLLYTDSEELNVIPRPATTSFDGNTETFWHTEFRNTVPAYPHEIQIDLGDVYDIDGFRYLPRQDDFWENSSVKDYEFYVSSNGVNWEVSVARGTFTYSTAREEKEILFVSTTGRYVRFVALSAVHGSNWTSLAELNVLGSETAVTTEKMNSSNEIYACLSASPNPFSTSIVISYSISENSCPVCLKIFGIKGELVKDLYSGNLNFGIHSVVWDGRDNSNVPAGSGMYLVRLMAGKRLHVMKAVKE